MEKGEIVLYQPHDSIHIEVRMENETVWLTQAQMGQLFGVDRTVVVKHIGNIYNTGELEELATCAKIAQVQQEGDRHVAREMKYYNLDMIISVGFRVNSMNATKFRQWANSVLKDYLIRGYVVNQRFKQLEQKVAEHDTVLSEHSMMLWIEKSRRQYQDKLGQAIIKRLLLNISSA